MTTTLDAAAITADRCLVEVADRLDYLLAVTPVDTEGIWRAFEASGHRRLPSLQYRPLPFDPAAERRALAEAPIDEVDDPAVRGILLRLREELLGLVRLGETRETPAFLGVSADVHGLVGSELAASATAVLDAVHGWSRSWDDQAVDAAGFAAAAREEIARLADRHPDLGAEVEIRTDVHGVMVVRRTLLVDDHYRIDPRRVDALVQHEVGTHIVTAVNGAAQPLRCLSTGLAGYEEAQEGIAVLAEHAIGGMTAERMALLAARVLACVRRCEEAPFADTVDELVGDHGFTRRAAFDVVLRVHRGGGLLKDAAYLRGLAKALDHVRAGRDLDLLLLGKVSFDDLDDLSALTDRGLLDRPEVRPRWADDLDADALPASVVELAAAVA
jgi:uncharacterized protein (TIGR02421 family)